MLSNKLPKCFVLSFFFSASSSFNSLNHFWDETNLISLLLLFLFLCFLLAYFTLTSAVAFYLLLLLFIRARRETNFNSLNFILVAIFPSRRIVN